MLGEYRTWLDKNHIPAESEYGWPRPQVFDAKNVDAFIEFQVGEVEQQS